MQRNLQRFIWSPWKSVTKDCPVHPMGSTWHSASSSWHGESEKWFWRGAFSSVDAGVASLARMRDLSMSTPRKHLPEEWGQCLQRIFFEETNGRYGWREGPCCPCYQAGKQSRWDRSRRAKLGSWETWFTKTVVSDVRSAQLCGCPRDCRGGYHGMWILSEVNCSLEKQKLDKG